MFSKWRHVRHFSASKTRLGVAPEARVKNPRTGYYEVLGVRPDATLTEIREAYFRKVKSCHPDVDPSPDSRKKFELVREAYAVLGARDKRIGYDRTLGKFNAAEGGDTDAAEYFEALKQHEESLDAKRKHRSNVMDERRKSFSVRRTWNEVYEMVGSGRSMNIKFGKDDRRIVVAERAKVLAKTQAKSTERLKRIYMIGEQPDEKTAYQSAAMYTGIIVSCAVLLASVRRDAKQT